MAGKRIDFAYIREHADIARVCSYYGIELQREGSRDGQHKAFCPFHNDQRPSLKVNTEKGAFNCFGCGEHGNVLDFVMKLDQIELRPAAEKVADICDIPTAGGSDRRRRSPAPLSREPAPPTAPEPTEPECAPTDESPANPPITFTLRLDTEPIPWLTQRGITADMSEAFGLGLATRGLLKGRIAIPIHNAAGALAAYCGRYPADEPPEDAPKYLLPKGFRKELEVFNLHRQPRGAKVLVAVESYLSVIKLHCWGLPVVSFMGRSVSDAQRALLREWGVGRLVVLFDGDQPGREGAAAVAGALASDTWVRVATLSNGTKPHHLDEASIRELLRGVW